MARTIHVKAPTSGRLQGQGAPPTMRYVAHDHAVPDDAGVGAIVTVEGKRARVQEASATAIVVVMEP